MGQTFYRCVIILLLALAMPVWADEIADALEAKALSFDGSTQGLLAQQLVSDALLAYRANNLNLTINLLNLAQELYPADWELAALISSLRRLVFLRDNEAGLLAGNALPPVGNGEVLNWELDDLEYSDRNRYLLAIWLRNGFSFINIINDNSSWRGGTNLTIEAFLPATGRRFGVEAGIESLYFDFDTLSAANDYLYWRYLVALQWRIDWALPVIEERVTLALKFGIKGQLLNLRQGDFAEPSLQSYWLPFVEVTIQEAVLKYIRRNAFTENFTVRLFANLGLRPAFNDNDTTSSFIISFGGGLYYHVNNFLLGGYYHYNRQISNYNGAIASTNMVGLAVSYQF